jgi:hypothetical protein
METKTVETKVTSAMLVAAQGGVGGGDDLLTVECPVSYRADKITAADIVRDDAITVVRAED